MLLLVLVALSHLGSCSDLSCVTRSLCGLLLCLLFYRELILIYINMHNVHTAHRPMNIHRSLIPPSSYGSVHYIFCQFICQFVFFGIWIKLKSFNLLCIVSTIFIITSYLNLTLFTLTFRSLSETFAWRSLFSSSSSSCHGSDVTWQEIGRMCGSVCSCPHPSSLNNICLVMVSTIYNVVQC